MPKKPQKPIHEMTSEELAQKVFHPKVLAKAKKHLSEQSEKPQRRTS